MRSVCLFPADYIRLLLAVYFSGLIPELWAISGGFVHFAGYYPASFNSFTSSSLMLFPIC